jgi:DNA sulfur modification protein DndD
MIIRRLEIENFISYHGTEVFVFDDGFNLIVGQNGHGKTACIEAFEWLFGGTSHALEMLVSRKALASAAIDEPFDVRVTIEIEQFGNRKRITRSFSAIKRSTELSENGRAIPKFDVSAARLQAEVDTSDGGRTHLVDGQSVLDSAFPFEIRSYSIFKGEGELRKLEREGTLNALINSFSDGKHYEKMLRIASFMADSADKEVSRFSTAVSKNRKLYERIDGEISAKKEELKGVKTNISLQGEQKAKIDDLVDKAELLSEQADALKLINESIKKGEEDLARNKSKLEENYTEQLFDDKWILMHFAPFQEKFRQKAKELERAKRNELSAFAYDQGVRKGAAQAQLEGPVPLPPSVPNRRYMEEMLNDEICKVCNTVAKKGSAPYLYMKKRLEDYIEKVEGEPVGAKGEKEELFPNGFIESIVFEADRMEEDADLVVGAKVRLNDILELNNATRARLKDIETNLDRLERQKQELIGQAGQNEGTLTSMGTNYKNWVTSLTGIATKLSDLGNREKNLENELRELNIQKSKIDQAEGNKELLKIQAVTTLLRDVMHDTKKRKFREFVALLELKANEKLSTVNVDALTGRVQLRETGYGDASALNVHLVDANGEDIARPNESLKTAMHVSVLLAISEIAVDIKSEGFPIILDAPVSSFDEKKKTDFLNHLAKVDGIQRIVLLKDFLIEDKKTGEVVLSAEFHRLHKNKAFRLKLRTPYDKEDISTLSTQVIEA